MIAEYLDRSSLVARMKYYEEHTTEESGEHYAYSVALREIRNAPAADVAEVGHARWERVRSNWYCTGCNKGYRITKGAPMASGFSYCPNCGAKMDGAAE